MKVDAVGSTASPDFAPCRERLSSSAGRRLPTARHPASAARAAGARSGGAARPLPGPGRLHQGPQQPEAAPALHLARCARARRRASSMRSSRCSARTCCCWARAVLRQAGGRRGLRELAPGRDLLGPFLARRRHRLGRADTEHARVRLHAGRARARTARRCRTKTASTTPTCCRAARRSRSRSIRRTVVDVELQPGEMSLHHVLLFHGSEPNRSAAAAHRLRHPLRADARAPALADPRQRAARARHDEYGHFEHERSPESRPASRCRGAPRRRHRPPAAHPLRRRAGARQAQPEAARPGHQGDDMRVISTSAWPPLALAAAADRVGTGNQDPLRAFAVADRAGAPGGRVLCQERRRAHQRQRADHRLSGRAARPRQGRQRDDPPGRERDEHHRPRLPLRFRARRRRAQRAVPDQDAAGVREAARLRLVQGHREEAGGGRLQADHGQRLLRPAPAASPTSRCASPRTWPA